MWKTAHSILLSSRVQNAKVLQPRNWCPDLPEDQQKKDKKATRMP